MRMIALQTRKALRKRLTGSQCALAQELDEPVAVISDVLAGRHAHVSRQAEDRIRGKLGLTLRQDRRRCLHASPALYARLQAQRGELTQEQFLTQLADLWDRQ